MCGIVYTKSFKDKDVTDVVLRQFEQQRQRGTTSFGYYLPEFDKMVHNIKEQRIKKLLRRTRGNNHEVLFHHRLSTSTADVRSACHPFSTKDTFDHEYIGVHNGMVSNSHAVKYEHYQKGIKYVSEQQDKRFNDSEALIFDIAEVLEGRKEEMKSYGTIAFIMIRLTEGKPDKLYFGTNRGSLNFFRSKKQMMISSEGKGQPVKGQMLHTFDYETGEITSEPMKIPSSYTFTKASDYTPTPYTYQPPILSKTEEEEEKEIEQTIISLFPTDDEQEKYGLLSDGSVNFRPGNGSVIARGALIRNEFDNAAAAQEIRNFLIGVDLEIERMNSNLLDDKDPALDELFKYYEKCSDYADALEDALAVVKERIKKHEFGFHN